MADAALKIFRQNKWFGGYSDDEFLGNEGSFWRGSGIEIRRFPRRLQIQKNLSDQAGAVITRPVRGEIVTTQFGDTIAVGDGGKVYRRAAGGTTWALVYTDTSTRNILDIREFNDYLYWTTATKLHRVPMGDTGTNTTWTTVTEDYKTLSVSSSASHPLFTIFNKLYVGDGNVLDELDSLSVWTAAVLSVEAGFVIRRINSKGSLIRLWARRSVNTFDTGRVYFWNGASAAYNDMTELDGMFQTCDERSDFFVAGWEPHLYFLNGNIPEKVKKLPQLTNPLASDADLIAADFAPNAMASMNGVVYVGSPTTIGSVGVSWQEKGVWSWGALNSGFPNSLNLDFPITVDQVTCLIVAEGKLNISAVNGATEYQYVTVPSQYQTTGEIEFRIFDGNEAWQRKDVKKISLSFAKLAAGENIEVFVKTNLDAAYGSAILTAAYANTLDRDVTFKDMVATFTGKQFNQAQFKIKLTAGTSNGTTPKLFDFAVTYEDILTM